MNSGSPSTPSSPYTLTNERYKANVNRTKTRKWVEAKKIDYGGDDWGADDDFEEDDADDTGSPPEPAEPIPQPQHSRTDRLAGLRAIGDGSGSVPPRSGSAGSARSLRPSERIAMERHGSGGVQQRNVTAPPALHANTGAQPQPPVQPLVEQQEALAAEQKSPFPPRESSMDQQDRPDLTIEPAVQHPVRTSSRSASPGFRSQPAAPGSSTSPRLVRPSEIYKRMEEAKESERKSPESAGRTSLDKLGSGDGPDTVNAQRRPSFGRNDGDVNRPTQPLASVVGSKNECGFDGLTVNPGAPPPPGSKLANDTATETTRDIETRQDLAASLSSEPSPPPIVQYPPQSSDNRPPAQIPPKRYSTSPKLPEFARLSGFGSDFFSGGGSFLSASGSALPKQPEAPAAATYKPATGSNLGPGSATGVTRTAAEPARHDPRGEEETATQTDGLTPAFSNTQPPPEPSHPKPFRPSLPGGWVSETPSSTGDMATPLSEQGDRALNPRIPPIDEHSDDAFMKPAPLRTPTPRDRESFSKFGDDDRASNHSGRSSPVKPPPLRTTASLLSNVEQSDRTPTQTDYTDTEAHQGSDETPIAPAPLQPRKSAGELASQDRPQAVARTDTMLTEASTAPQESDFLRDEIMRSLSPTRRSVSHLDTQDDDGAARESAYLSDVYGDYWDGGDKKTEDERQQDDGHVDALAMVKDDGPPYASSAAHAAVAPDAVKKEIRRERFSWEGSIASPAPSPTKHPLPPLPTDEPSPALEAQPLAGPANSGRMSPTISLPVRGMAHNTEEATSQDEEATSKDERTSGDAVATNAFQRAGAVTPPSLHLDHDTITATSLFSPESAKTTADSPTTPTASTNPYFTAVDPGHMCSDSPTDIPLPQSPTTPTQTRVAAAEKDSDLQPTASRSAVEHTMSLKQIIGLPTSPERVYKLHEARAEFAITPTGLAGWLGQLLAMPEHANAGPNFKYAPAGDDLPLFTNQTQRARRSQHGTSSAAAEGGAAGGGGSGGGGATAVRRSSVTLGGTGGGSVRIAAGAQAQLGHLMHGPAGAKGKELLHSAGKMGKGLLSKGKSKLRERAESKK